MASTTTSTDESNTKQQPNEQPNAATAAAAAAKNNSSNRQIPIVCPGHTRPLAELSFCHVPEEDRTLLVSACHDRMPMLRDGTSGDWIGTFVGHKGAVWSTRLDPSGSLAATASGDFYACVWDAVTGTLIQKLAHKHIVKTCDFSPNSQLLATGGHEGILRVYDLTTITTTPENNNNNNNHNPEEAAVAAPLEIPQSDQKKIVISKCCWKTDTVLLAGCADGAIRIWNVDATTQPPKVSLAHTLQIDDKAEIRDMELSTNVAGNQEILTVAAGDKVYFYDLSSNDKYSLMHCYKMPIHFREEGGASLHPSGKKFIAAGSDLWVRVFDFETGQELECLKGHHGPIRCLRYSPNGKIYASGSEDGTIRLWQSDPQEE